MSLGTQTVEQYTGRINADYISYQVDSFRQAERHKDHKKRINDNDDVYAGNLTKLFPEDDLPETPLVENSFKRSLHDLARLSSEAKPMPVWMVRGKTIKETN